MAPISTLDHLSNPLITVSQLRRLRETDTGNSHSNRFAQYHLCQAAGILLRVPQEVIATAIVLLQRYLTTNSKQNDSSYPPSMLCATAIYLSAKLSFTPLSPRSVINVFTYLTSTASPLWYINPPPADPEDPNPSSSITTTTPDPNTYYVSEGTYLSTRQMLFSAESHFLGTLGFQTHVALPHALSLTYLQLLCQPTPILTTRVLAHLNSALLSPQFLYLTHQPNALAVAAIYLAARETGTKLPEVNWWEVFDVEREDLGFLVHALASFEGFVADFRRECVERSHGVDWVG